MAEKKIKVCIRSVWGPENRQELWHQVRSQREMMGEAGVKSLTSQSGDQDTLRLRALACLWQDTQQPCGSTQCGVDPRHQSTEEAEAGGLQG